MIGVFSSCETLATRSRRLFSRFSSSALMRLNAVASSPHFVTAAGLHPHGVVPRLHHPGGRRHVSERLCHAPARGSARRRARRWRRPRRRGGTATTRSGGSRWSQTTAEESSGRRSGQRRDGPSVARSERWRRRSRRSRPSAAHPPAGEAAHPRSVPRTSVDPSGWRITTIAPGGTESSLPVAALRARLRASIASESRGEFRSANAIST